jgi:transposase
VDLGRSFYQQVTSLSSLSHTPEMIIPRVLCWDCSDRFHVAKQYRDCADQARKAEMKRLKQTLPKSDYAQLKGAMWVFRKPWSALTEEQGVVLLRLFEQAPILKEVYVQREQLTNLFEKHQSKAQAEQVLTQWLKRITDLGLKCFSSFVTTLDNWRDEITNYFIRRETSGFVEGLNNKIKVIKRRCYGIYNLGRLFQHIWLDVQGRRVLFAEH